MFTKLEVVENMLILILKATKKIQMAAKIWNARIIYDHKRNLAECRYTY